MSSPMTPMGTDLGYGSLEAEQVPYARIAERRNDEVRGVEVDAGERRHADDGHPGGARGGDAGLGVLERNARAGVFADPGGCLEIDVGRRLGPRDVLGAHDGVEVLVDA